MGVQGFSGSGKEEPMDRMRTCPRAKIAKPKHKEKAPPRAGLVRMLCAALGACTVRAYEANAQKESPAACSCAGLEFRYWVR